MKSTSKNREQLEEAILGVLLLEDKYFAICNILKGENFSDWKELGHNSNRVVFNAIATLSLQQRRVDIITVSNYLRDILPVDNYYSFYVSELTNKVSSSCNLGYWALCLLQIDITEKFAAMISGMAESCGPEEGVQKANYIEVLEALQTEDIFDVIDSCYSSMVEVGALEDDIKSVKEFKDAIEKKCTKINRFEQVDFLINQLRKCHGAVHEHYASMGLDMLQRLLVAVMVKGQASSEFYTLLCQAEGALDKKQEEKRIIKPLITNDKREHSGAVPF